VEAEQEFIAAGYAATPTEAAATGKRLAAPAAHCEQ